jgi:hypothetical protein
MSLLWGLMGNMPLEFCLFGCYWSWLNDSQFM